MRVFYILFARIFAQYNDGAT